MADRHKLYKEVLDRAPFGTLLIAYGVCIDANRMALQILNCQRSDIVGAALSEAQSHQPASIEQLKQVVDKLQRDQLSGILWRSENILKEDEVVVSLGPVETADSGDDVLSITLYPLPALAHMVVKEFSTVPVVTSDQPKLVKPVVAPIEAELKNNLEDTLAGTLEGTLEGSLEGSLEDKSEKPSAPAVSATKQSERDRYETLSGLPVSPRLIHSIGDYLDNPQSDTACGTLLLIDLDHFNSINESLGKALGNQILERAAETIEGLCTDNMEMDQVAGDSFLVLIKNIAENAEQARQASLAIANEIRCILTRPFLPKMARSVLPPVLESVCSTPAATMRRRMLSALPSRQCNKPKAPCSKPSVAAATMWCCLTPRLPARRDSASICNRTCAKPWPTKSLISMCSHRSPPTAAMWWVVKCCCGGCIQVRPSALQRTLYRCWNPPA